MKITLSEVLFRNENQNSAKNFNKVNIGYIALWFSYETIVAFRTPQTGLVVCENVWGTTTGKHLNWIDDDKSIRVPREEFLDKLNSIVLNVEIQN